jgi:RecB family exonuclease
MLATVETPAQTDHLSWSSTQTFRACPRQYQLHYIERAESERVCASLLFGGAIHSAIELVHEARLCGAAQPTEDELLTAFDAAWKEGATKAAEVWFAKADDAVTLRGLAKRVLAAYQENVMEERDVIAVEEEVRFKLLPGLPPVLARIDLIEARGEDLVLTDFKTSKCSWSESKMMENLPQLILYAHAALPMLRSLGLRRVVPQFVVLTKGKKPKIQVLRPAVERSHVERLKTTFGETWTSIQKGWFPKSESWRCPSCPYRTRCLGH